MDHVVRAGESVWAIAQRHGTTVQEIARANGLRDASLIHPGQVLKLPTMAQDSAQFSPSAQGAWSINLTPGAAPAPAPAPRPQTRPAPAPSTQDPGNIGSLSRRDFEALVRAVAAEARGESPQAWEAVAQTIINYAQRNDKSIHRLVRSSYLSSNFDGNRRYYTMPYGQIPNLQGIEAAVRRAAQPGSIVGDRMHFHDTSIRTPSFGDRSTRMQIGDLVFYDPKGRGWYA